MRNIKTHIYKIAVFFAMAFLLTGALIPTSAAGAVSKPIRIEQLSDGGGFFVLTFQERIHPSLPAFSFDIYALPIGKGANYQARRIIVTESATKNVVQEISLFKVSRLIDYPTTSQKENMGFVIEDMNFDGYQDIRIIAFMPGGTRIPYFYWFWNNEAQKFIKNPALEEITSPVFDPVQKTIHSPVNIPGRESYDIVYKYVNAVPITKEDYLKNLLYLEHMEAGLKNQADSEKKKTANNCYKGWNDELNNIFEHLLKETEPQLRENLKASHKQWLADRETEAKKAGNMQPDNYSFAHTYSLMLSTKNKTLALIDTFFDGEKK